jgi:hypothetical protein
VVLLGLRQRFGFDGCGGLYTSNHLGACTDIRNQKDLRLRKRLFGSCLWFLLVVAVGSYDSLAPVMT